jgi:hypothetical protein
MTIEFNTREFEFEHGHKPRGYGHWAFGFDAPPRGDDKHVYWVNGRYSDAKVCARVEAMRRRAATVFVGA